MPSIFGGSFAALRQQLGLGATMGSGSAQFPVDVGGLGFGTDYLRSNQGSGAMYDLYADQYARTNPALARAIRNNKGAIESKYGTAAAVDPTLQRDQFLSAYDPMKNLYKSLTPIERYGYRGSPGNFAGRGFRTLSA